MVEYAVDTLVHLYDSLNGQIEVAQNDLKEFANFDLNLLARAKLDAIHTKIEKRLERLINMRDKVEYLINKILTAEVNE